MKLSYLKGLSGGELSLTLPTYASLIGELQPHVHHVTCARAEMNRDFRSGISQQARMIRMGVG